MATLDSTVTSTLDPYGGTRNAHLEDRMIADSIALNIQSALKTFGGASGFSLAPRSSTHTKTIAVNHVSFQVKRGEIFGVLGPNGSGKSTLIRLIATLLVPDGGTISVFGHDVTREPMAVQRLINRVSVEASFFKKLSPMETCCTVRVCMALTPSKRVSRSCPFSSG
jgi:ABC-type multidrug transport system ATPase subunit